MPDLLPITITDMLGEVERELRYRRIVYPKLIAARTLSPQKADRQIELMQAVSTLLARKITTGDR